MNRTVEIGGIKYPCLLTLGAMKEFKNETGQGLESIDKAPDADKTDLVMILVYCCIKSACRREGIDIPFSSSDEMLDHVMPTELPDLVGAISVDPNAVKQPAARSKKKR